MPPLYLYNLIIRHHWVHQTDQTFSRVIAVQWPFSFASSCSSLSSRGHDLPMHYLFPSRDRESSKYELGQTTTVNERTKKKIPIADNRAQPMNQKRQKKRKSFQSEIFFWSYTIRIRRSPSVLLPGSPCAPAVRSAGQPPARERVNFACMIGGEEENDHHRPIARRRRRSIGARRWRNLAHSGGQRKKKNWSPFAFHRLLKFNKKETFLFHAFRLPEWIQADDDGWQIQTKKAHHSKKKRSLESRSTAGRQAKSAPMMSRHGTAHSFWTRCCCAAMPPPAELGLNASRLK